MRLTSLAAFALLSSVALAGCGSSGKITVAEGSSPTTASSDAESDGGGGGGSDEDRDALIAYIAGSDGTMVDQAQGECVADQALGDLGSGALEIVGQGGDFDLTAFGDRDAQLLIDAIDECIPLDDALTSFADGIASQADLPLTPEEAACTVGVFGADYEGAGEFIAATTAMSEDDAAAQLLAAIAPCITAETATSFMTTTMSGQGLDDATAQCVAETLVADLGPEALFQAITEAGTSGSSSVLQDASVAAGASCAAGLPAGGTIPSIGGGLSGN